MINALKTSFTNQNCAWQNTTDTSDHVTITNAQRQTVNLLVESSNLSFPAILNKSSSYAHSGTTPQTPSLPPRIENIPGLPALNRKPYIMGIDPGVTGAVAIIDYVTFKLVTVFDFPTEKNSKGRSRIDFLKTAFLIDAYASLTVVALIEEVGQVGTNADPFSAFVFGFATGGVHGVLSACLIPIALVKPQVWKMDMGLSSNKEDSVARAISLFPNEAPKYLKLKKHHGRAEAILLAWYARKHLRVAV